MTKKGCVGTTLGSCIWCCTVMVEHGMVNAGSAFDLSSGIASGWVRNAGKKMLYDALGEPAFVELSSVGPNAPFLAGDDVAVGSNRQMEVQVGSL